MRNADDSECRDIGFDGPTISYGIEEKADIMATNIEKKDEAQTFKVGDTTYNLKVPGDFNIYNALAVIAYATHLGISDKAIKTGIEKFTGTWRRFENVGTYRDAQVISDYAHHPTAVEGLIKAAKEWYPDKRIVMVFQPHQHDRTKKLFKGFTKAFDQADLIIIQEIYDVAGRTTEEDQAVTSKTIVDEVEQHGKLVIYSPDHQKTKQLLAEHIESNDIILIVGAGSIYTIAEDICSNQ